MADKIPTIEYTDESGNKYSFWLYDTLVHIQVDKPAKRTKSGYHSSIVVLPATVIKALIPNLQEYYE